MSDDTEGSAAMLGSVAGKPVAWVVLDSRGTACLYTACQETAEAYCESTFNRCVPLYRHPSQMLTAEERRGVTRALQVAKEFHDSRLIATLRGLLERTK